MGWVYHLGDRWSYRKDGREVTLAPAPGGGYRLHLTGASGRVLHDDIHREDLNVARERAVRLLERSADVGREPRGDEGPEPLGAGAWGTYRRRREGRRDGGGALLLLLLLGGGAAVVWGVSRPQSSATPSGTGTPTPTETPTSTPTPTPTGGSATGCGIWQCAICGGCG